MKHSFFTLLLLPGTLALNAASTVASAQNLAVAPISAAVSAAIAPAAAPAAAVSLPENIHRWNQANLDYTAEVQGNGSILFTAMDEGQELGFRFTPKPGKADEFVVADDGTGYSVNPFSDAVTARYVNKDGMKLICLYNNRGTLCDVLTPSQFEDGTRQAEQVWTAQIVGEFVSPNGTPLVIRDNGTIKYGSNNLTYKHVTFNGTIIGIIEVEGGSPLQGLWRVQITPEGLNLIQVVGDEYGFFSPTGKTEAYTWSRRDIPRFDYASKVLLNDKKFRWFDDSLLRLIRNEILFHHGYVPSSADLKQYLSDKQWYTPNSSNEEAVRELNLIENLNIELIKTLEDDKALHVKQVQEVTQLVNDVYDYLEEIRQFYMNAPEGNVPDRKWESLDERFGTKSWQALRQQAQAIDMASESGGVMDFGDVGPLDPWTYDCFEGKVTPQNIKVDLYSDGHGEVQFEIKDAMTIKPVSLSWLVTQENGQWRVDDIFFCNDDVIDLRELLQEYVDKNSKGKNRYSAIQPGLQPVSYSPAQEFDFDKYRAEMTEMANNNLMYRKSMDDVKLIAYALIDIDNDGRNEIWVRGDEGQDYQGIFGLTPAGELLYITDSDARSELVFYPGAVGSKGYYGDGEFREFVNIVKNSEPAGLAYSRVLINNYSEDQEVLEEYYDIFDKQVTEAQYNAFIKKLGEPYQPQVQWHFVENVPSRY